MPEYATHIVYFSHSYRKDDAVVNEYFGELMRSEELIASLDPPSSSLNSAKLERHLANTDGMVVILPNRQDGPSPYILYEIALCLRARKPLIVFVEDVLPNDIVPRSAYQARFSRNFLIRQTRENRHALKAVKGYFGADPPPKYQPVVNRRCCLLIGTEVLDDAAMAALKSTLDTMGYSPIDVDLHDDAPVYTDAVQDVLSSAGLAICFVDAPSRLSQFLYGASQARLLPTIALASGRAPIPSTGVPREFHPRVVDPTDAQSVVETIRAEIRVFEEDFVDFVNTQQVREYAELIGIVPTRPGRYSPATRQVFIQTIERLSMGDQYSVSGQVGAVGPNAHVHDVVFNQIWAQAQDQIDLQALSGELGRLRERMKEEASAPEHFVALGSVASAELAAKEGNGPETMKHLKSAGAWTFDIATKLGTGIGTGVAVAALKTALGI